MLKKWYISGLVVILAFWGISQNQTIKPNQEIVLRFSNTIVNTDNVHNTILEVKKQLSNIGAENITFSEGTDGHFIITYYSNLDVKIIKQVLSNQSNTRLDLDKDIAKNTSEHFPKGYDFDIKQLDGNLNNDLEGKASILTELKLDKPRFFNSNAFAIVNAIDIKQQIVFEKSFRIVDNILRFTNNYPFQIPDVRAGPVEVI